MLPWNSPQPEEKGKQIRRPIKQPGCFLFNTQKSQGFFLNLSCFIYKQRGLLGLFCSNMLILLPDLTISVPP